KKRILLNITDKGKREERSRLMDGLDKQKARDTIMARAGERRARKNRDRRYIAVAASVAILLGATFLLDRNGAPTVGTIVADNHISTGTDRATLTLADGSEVALEKGRPYRSGNVTGNGEEIVYLPAERPGNGATTEETAHNMLTVPRGGQFRITLSDGTKVWLNSESRLRYPVAFGDGGTREVTLVHGEAYFDVSPAAMHRGAKFKVRNRFQEVEVLGTEFNIRAYRDETQIYTTLVEGQVLVGHQHRKQFLAPAQQSILDTRNNNMALATVDTSKEVSWKQGTFSFQDKTLKEIMKVLSRWYDMEVVFADRALEDEMFVGTFKRDFSIEGILSAIKKTGSINGYNIKERTLTIE
ncbi:FecR family protein, partial [Flavivirga sp. 57AJ16]|uniref:FecR family protein n=2 Tax=Flavivirga sp. 57AJ16 TaxID=3025307 RepID=UPI002365F5A2